MGIDKTVNTDATQKSPVNTYHAFTGDRFIIN